MDECIMSVCTCQVARINRLRVLFSELHHLSLCVIDDGIELLDLHQLLRLLDLLLPEDVLVFVELDTGCVCRISVTVYRRECRNTGGT